MIEVKNIRGYRVLVIKTKWKKSYIASCHDNDINGLLLSYSDGWRGDNLEFLENVPMIKYLCLFDYSGIRLNGLEYLLNLEFLHLDILDNKIPAINLANHVKLRFYLGCWNNAIKSLLENDYIERLDLRNIKRIKEINFQKCANLLELSIMNARGVGNITLPVSGRLKNIKISNMSKLININNLSTQINLRYLIISNCKLLKFNLLHLNSIKILQLRQMGEMLSLPNINGCRDLEQLWLGGDTIIIDGDLSILKSFSKLKILACVDYMHYKPRRSEFNHSIDTSAFEKMLNSGVDIVNFT